MSGSFRSSLTCYFALGNSLIHNHIPTTHSHSKEQFAFSTFFLYLGTLNSFPSNSVFELFLVIGTQKKIWGRSKSIADKVFVLSTVNLDSVLSTIDGFSEHFQE